MEKSKTSDPCPSRDVQAGAPHIVDRVEEGFLCAMCGQLFPVSLKDAWKE